ncbi:hypothetical protein M0R88_14905 [Halorussus gelatinilyticus]|uniref:Uncharacterized protein n=1 Tax=Halorussus gelatinilyticus TaxID=2937524 RepID=A0A8U0IFE7_9EURY|nr:hypothetical protein [Halorussus gelatinilyticus]UPV99796.1 hypothetical protein M0R88_14905 [Halorussus gelatinilyticus]
MPPSRRALLRTGLLGVAGALAGCSGREETTTQTTRTTKSTPRTTRHSTDARTTIGETTEATRTANATAVEFVHRAPVFGWGVADAGTWYYGHVLDGEGDADGLDASSVPGDVAGQDPETVRRFVADTDFETTAILAVQAEVESSSHGLDFEFVNRASSPPRVVAFLRDRDRAEFGSGVSTLLVRVPAADASRVETTVVESDFAFDGRERHPVVTFAPPNDTQFESVRVRGRDLREEAVGLPDPGGALITEPDAASAFAGAESVFSEFVRATDFDRSYLLAVRSSFDALDYFWPQSVVQDGGRVVADVRQYDPQIGINPIYSSVTLTRIRASSPPDRGTAVVRRYREARPNVPVETEIVPLSADPEKWRRATRTATTAIETTRGKTTATDTRS